MYLYNKFQLGGDMNYGAIATVTERSEEMPVVQSTYFDSLRGAPPRGHCPLN